MKPFFWWLLAAVWWPSLTIAHPLAPALLDLVEEADGSVDVRWRTSVLRAQGVTIAPQWPPDCSALAVGDAVMDGDDAVVEHYRLACPPPGLAGRAMTVSGLDAAGITVILRWTPHRGSGQLMLLDGLRPSVLVPERTVAWAVVPRYLQLGVEHLLLGPDHVLFVIGLLLLIRGLRRQLLTLTAFTLGHSVTLALAALDLLVLPARLTEFVIALSLLVLAVDLARPPGQRPSWLARFPYVMALGFGLFHGLGFAGVLTEIGLPAGAVLPALLAFNLGIEVGQIILALFLLGGAAVLRRAGVGLDAPLTRVLPVYLIGVLAAYWCFERAFMS